MILGCTAVTEIKKTKATITLLQEEEEEDDVVVVAVAVAVAVGVVVWWHVFSMQIGQAEKTIQICAGSQR